MKKKLLLACCTVALVLSACGGTSNNGSTTSNNTEQTVNTGENSEQESNQEASSNSEEAETDQTEASENSEEEWNLQQEVDEFGDVKKDGSTLAIYEIDGTFSNTATNGSELGGTVVFDAANKAFFFNLHEYKDDTNATYISSDSIVLKYKAGDDDTIHTHYLGGKAPNSAVVLNDSTERELNKMHEVISTSSGFLALGTELWYGNEVRCIIEIGNSSYNFNIEPSNFQAVSKSVGLSFENLPKEEAIPLALQSYINFEEYEAVVGNPNAIAATLLLSNLSEDDKVSEDEYNNLMVGHWGYYDLFCTGRAACVENYDDGSWTDGGWIYPDKHDHEEDEKPKAWSVEDGLIKQLRHTYKLFDTGCEGYYVLYCVDEGKSAVQRQISTFIMVKLDDNCKPLNPPVYK